MDEDILGDGRLVTVLPIDQKTWLGDQRLSPIAPEMNLKMWTDRIEKERMLVFVSERDIVREPGFFDGGCVVTICQGELDLMFAVPRAAFDALNRLVAQAPGGSGR